MDKHIGVAFDAAMDGKTPAHRLFGQRSTYGQNAAERHRQNARSERGARQAGAIAARAGIPLDEAVQSCERVADRNAFTQGYNSVSARGPTVDSPAAAR